MNLPSSLKRYTSEQLSAREAQRQAEFIAWGPIVFQASRLMLKFGILEMLRDNEKGLTTAEVAERSGLSLYACKCLLEASLSIGTVLINPDTDRYSISKTGWFLLNDPATKVNIDFNHDVNYLGMFNLEEALMEGRPVGLKHLGDWPTLYEGLSSFPPQAKESWLNFDQSDYPRPASADKDDAGEHSRQAWCGPHQGLRHQPARQRSWLSQKRRRPRCHLDVAVPRLLQ